MMSTTIGLRAEPDRLVVTIDLPLAKPFPLDRIAEVTDAVAAFESAVRAIAGVEPGLGGGLCPAE